jgi:RNA methyltransferase, TrmH family
MNQNEIKKVSSLTQGKYRKEYGLFLAEGIHVVEELLKSSWAIQLLVVSHEAADSGNLKSLIDATTRRRVKVEAVTRIIFDKLTTTDTPQGILAVAKLPPNDPGRLISQNRILIADGVSDPGNLGTMIRTAAAFGFGGFVTTPGSADIFNPKTVRATQGALFHLVVANHLSYEDIASKLKMSHRIYALSAEATADLQSVKPAVKSALVVGAEISGVSREILKIADQIIRIPMSGPVESLNAAVAAGIAMYEFVRRG